MTWCDCELGCRLPMVSVFLTPTVLQTCRLLKPPDDCHHALTKLVAKDGKTSQGENMLREEGFKVNVPWLLPGFCHIRPRPAVRVKTQMN